MMNTVITGALKDDENPIFIFSMTSTKLLAAISKGDINALNLARQELINRGIGTGGHWVGFKQAKIEWEGKI